MMYPVQAVQGRKNLVFFFHEIVTGAAGVIATQDAGKDSGVVAAKTPATVGRYTLILDGGKKYKKCHGVWPTVRGPATAVYGAKTTGNNFCWRQNDIDGNNLDGSCEVQFMNPSTDATNYIDAEVPDNTVIGFLIAVSL